MNRMVLRSWPLAAACLLLLACCPAFTAEPSLTKSTIFEAGQGGYMMYRIPGIVVTKRGTVLVYNEARRNSGSDWGTIDIVMRRSTDGGATFSPAHVLAHSPTPITRNPVAIERKQGEPTDITYNNPVAISGRDGVVHFLFCVEYMRVFYMRSTDDGKNFSTPVEITRAFDAFKRKYPWRVAATGPGHGIELSNGRLIVPVWLALGTKGNGHSPSETATVYSDDGGSDLACRRNCRAGYTTIPQSQRNYSCGISRRPRDVECAQSGKREPPRHRDQQRRRYELERTAISAGPAGPDLFCQLGALVNSANKRKESAAVLKSR